MAKYLIIESSLFFAFHLSEILSCLTFLKSYLMSYYPLLILSDTVSQIL